MDTYLVVLLIQIAGFVVIRQRGQLIMGEVG